MGKIANAVPGTAVGGRYRGKRNSTLTKTYKRHLLTIMAGMGMFKRKSRRRAEKVQKKFRRKRRRVMSANTAVIEELHQAIVEQRNMEELEGLLWAGVLAYQGKTFYTLSGLEFSYMVKHKKNGDYSGELLISRKETSKTLTRSSVMLALHKVLAEMKFKEINGAAYLLPPEYRGPKSIGQIFGISYIFSMFLEFGLIRTNEKKK